ncbi:MAG: nucleotidyltransferase domain-containing protein [Fusobacteria bacterium]|nr:nucleotidyltransferase domain-containing protein [Fusobacteriota bacterium]
MNSSMIVERLKEFSPEVIYIFGSVAKGEERKGSDIDIAFYSNCEQTALGIYTAAQELAIKLNRDVDLVDLRRVGSVLQKEIVEHGKVIFEKSASFRSEMELKIIKNYVKFCEERKSLIENFEV